MDTHKTRARPALAAVRTRHGMRQEDAAAAIGVSPSTWARWERGEHDVRARHRARVAEVFGVPLDEVERWINGCEEPSAFPWAGTWTGAVEGTVETSRELWRWGVDPSRRRVLATLPWVPAFLSEWLLSWSLDPAAESRAHAGAGTLVGMEDVHRIQATYQAFIQMDHQFGGGMVRPVIADYLHAQVSPLLRGTYTDEVGAALMTAAAYMTGVAGWAAYDLLQHGLAQVHFGQALRLAKVADDPLASAAVLSVMAQQTIDLHQPTWSIRLACAARHAGERADASPRVRARLLLREARAMALGAELADTRDAHTAARVERILGQAEEMYARATPGDDDPAWFIDVTPAQVAAEAGRVWHMIGNHNRAVACAERAVAGYGPTFPRSSQLNRVHRGRALLHLGELDEAIASARAAVPAANTLASSRSTQLVKAFDAELDPYSREPQVRQWREYLRTTLHPTAA